jgi:hypothetical protein
VFCGHAGGDDLQAVAIGHRDRVGAARDSFPVLTVNTFLHILAWPTVTNPFAASATRRKGVRRRWRRVITNSFARPTPARAARR